MSLRPEGLDRNRGTMQREAARKQWLRAWRSRKVGAECPAYGEERVRLGRSDSEAFPSFECRRCVGGPLAPLTSLQSGTGTEVGAGRPSPRERGRTNLGH